MCAHQEGLWVRMSGWREPENNPITVKLETSNPMAEQFSWVPLPYCSLPRHTFPIKSALSACVSLQTIHFWELDKSPICALERVPLPATNGNSGGASSSLWLISWPLKVLRDQLTNQSTRPSSCNCNPFVSDLLLTQMTDQSALTR